MEQPTKHEPLIVAHRGASAYAPENTLAAIKLAIECGADGVEFDVQLARDGVPVVIHDQTLDRTALRAGVVSDHTSAALNEIDVGSWFNAKHPDRASSDFALQTVPTLDEVLKALQQFHGLIYIELKPNENDLRSLVNAVCDHLRVSPLRPQIIVKSFSFAALPEIKHHLPDVQTAALFAPTIMDILRRRRDIVSIARAFGADQISVHRSLVTRKLISAAAHAQMPVTVWTSDKPKWVRKCQKLGIRALITNDPAKLLKYRNEIAR